MSFTKALYYQSIDIADEAWLKSAILFWDEIKTIVPASVSDPYKNDATKYLYDEGILKPIIVDSASVSVQRASHEVLDLIKTQASSEFIKSKVVIDQNHINRPLYGLLTVNAKISSELRSMIASYSDSEYYNISLHPGFVSYYLSLLAAKISEDYSLSIITNDTLSYNLSQELRHQYELEFLDDCYCKNDNISYSQGFLTQFVIDNIKIMDTTSLADIIDFKKRYRDELGRFRINLSKLANSANDSGSLDGLRENIHSVYTDEFMPAYNDFMKALKASKIKWIADNISKLCIFSTSTTALPVLLGSNIPQALFLGAGVSVMASTIAYNLEKKEKLRKNPYTYLLEIERNFN